jgi:septin family protein
MKWSNSKCQIRDDIYLVGCTNVGKSTLFNTFLQSDLCKVQAIDLIERATTSIWPGTTLNMLKFPVMNPSPHKLELRRQRLMDEISSRKNEEKFARTLIDTQRDGGVSSPFYVLQGVVDNSYRDLIEEQRFHRIDEFSNDVHRRSNADTRKERTPVWNPDDPQFASGRWCYDTPGTVNDNQVL